MKKIKEFKRKVKDNKYKIIMSTITIAGVVYIIVKQNGKIHHLELMNEEQQKDIDILKHVMDGTVLASLKESLTRKLRYREGKLNNALMKNSGISKADEIKLREEIEYFNKELEKIFEAERLLNNSLQRD